MRGEMRKVSSRLRSVHGRRTTPKVVWSLWTSGSFAVVVFFGTSPDMKTWRMVVLGGHALPYMKVWGEARFLDTGCCLTPCACGQCIGFALSL